MKPLLAEIEKQIRLSSATLSTLEDTKEIRSMQLVLKNLDNMHYYCIDAIKELDKLIANEK